RSEIAAVANGGDIYTFGGTLNGNPSTLSTANEVLSTTDPNDYFYSQGPFNVPGCGNSGGGGGGGDQGPTWRIIDPQTGMDSPVASIDANGLATALMPGTALVDAE